MYPGPSLRCASGYYIGNDFPYTEVYNKKRITEIGQRVRETFEFNIVTFSWDALYICHRNRKGSNQGYKAGALIPPINVSQKILQLSNIYGVLRCHGVLLIYEPVVVLSLGVLLDSKNQDKFQN